MVTSPYQIPLPPVVWPQDILKVPSIYGMGTPIDNVNSTVTKREYFGLPVTFTNIGYGESQQTVVRAPEDGDFWVCSIITLAVLYPTLEIQGSTPLGRVHLRDIITGYEPFRPYVTYTAVQALSHNSLFRQDFIQPYCLIRNGGFNMTVSLPAKAVARQGYNLYFIFHGWKEYKNAAK